MLNTIKNLEKELAELQNNPKATVQQKIDALNNLAWELQFDDPQRGSEFAETAYQLAQEHNYQKGLAYSLNNIGACAATLQFNLFQ